MLTPTGPKVLEYNARFGDPEAQVILPRLRGPFAQTLLAASQGRLAEIAGAVTWDPRAAACVVMASPGYPGSYPKGIRLEGLAAAEQTAPSDVVVFHAGTARDAAGRIVSAGGRVLGVTAFGADLRSAVGLAYSAIKKIQFRGAHYRSDIAAKAFVAR